MRLILIDAEIEAGAQAELMLRAEAYAVDRARTYSSADLALRTENYDLILLDLKLPDGSGLELIRKYRLRGGDAPVFVVTAPVKLADRVDALDGGADDYLTKPFYKDEMLARVRALLRRQPVLTQSWVEHGKLRVNFATHQTIFANAPVHLTLREFATLRALLSSIDRVVTLEQLERKVYSSGEEVESNAISVYIHRLRKKFGSGLIKNIHGVGFLIPSELKSES